MKLIIALFILLLFEGYDCEMFFVNGDNSACLYEKTGQPPFSKFFEKSVDNDLLFDYDFGWNSLYYFTSPEQISSGNMSRLVACRHVGPGSYCPEVTNLSMYYEVVDIDIDWVHYSLYVIDNGGRKLHINQLPKHGELLNTTEISKSIAVEDIARALGVKANQIRGLQVDPYKKFLFLQLSIENHFDSTHYADNNSDFIIRTDLSARGPHQTPEHVFSNEMMFYVDIGYLRIYILDKGTLNVYDYDGQKLDYTFSSFSFGSFASHFSVFRNNTYLYRNTDIVNYIVKVDLTQLKNTEDSVYSLYGGKFEFMLFDARTKRRMIDGSYICDRQDCADLCSVLPSGDTCECYKSRKQSADGLTCYDCGQANLTVTTITTSESKQDSSVNFPWIAQIFYGDKGKVWKALCGGTLVTSNTVLTRALCTTKVWRLRPKRTMVSLGNISNAWDTSNPNEIRPRVISIVAHPAYAGDTLNYFSDIALIKLENEVKINEFVMPACIDHSQNQLPSHNTLTAYGVSTYLKESNLDKNAYNYSTVRVVNHMDCIKTYNKKKETATKLTLDRFCLDVDLPTLDTGHGLFVFYRGFYYIVGVMNIPLLVDDEHGKTVEILTYTNISYHMDWIKNVLYSLYELR